MSTGYRRVIRELRKRHEMNALEKLNELEGVSVNRANYQLFADLRIDITKLQAFVEAYDKWLELFMQDGREDLEDDGSLEQAVATLDSARKALKEPAR